MLVAAFVLAAAIAAGGGIALSHFQGAERNALPQGAVPVQQPALGKFVPTEPARPAPDTAFEDAAGKRVTLADFRGRTLLVNLWATWCGPCVREMPALGRLAAAMAGKDFAVVLVSEDRGGAATVEPFIAKHDLGALGSDLDPKGDLGRAFGVRGLPTTILIGADGKERGRIEGAADWDGETERALLRRLIAGDGKTAAK
jgi:thiol-disulfide isomerase/thioredoxin